MARSEELRARQRIRDRERRRNVEVAASRAKMAAGLQFMSIKGRVNAEDVEARMAEIPADTRDLTAWTFGDPLPGRSALDQRRSA